YHDMGLIGPVLNTVYTGGTSTLFSPLDFLQQPRRWLDAVSRHRPHTSGAPNFAYELALKHAPPAFPDELDLSGWRVAFNGAEPVRAATLRRFADTFAPAGFRPEALTPCYGLAEATLMVTSGRAGAPPTLLRADDGGPHAGAADAAAVGTGRPGPGVTVVVADPDTLDELPDGEVGEIRVGGPSVARGYWRNALATRETFRAGANGRDGRFPRTRDPGPPPARELLVTGRPQDLIAVAGRNHYPQGRELTADTARPAPPPRLRRRVRRRRRRRRRTGRPRRRDVTGDRRRGGEDHRRGPGRPRRRPRTGGPRRRPGPAGHHPQDVQREDPAPRLPHGLP